MGVESGNEQVLQDIQKGASYAQLVEAAGRVKAAGIGLSVTVLLGIGGVERSTEHALDTARILIDMDPDFVGALTVMLVPGTPLHDDFMAGRFTLPDTFGFLKELGIMIGSSNFTDCFFTSNHASNYLPIRARLPERKEITVAAIQRIIEQADTKVLRPEYLRGL
jgi:radical SAM superfamily enzyme YgiQ (UPF0313 family)